MTKHFASYLAHLFQHSPILPYNKVVAANKHDGGQMALPLLSTKFYIPPPRPDSVARTRLAGKLLEGANRSQSFTLLSGPAGSGKTTLLSQVVTHLEMPVAWLSLDESDDDPDRFWTYLITACQQALAGVGAARIKVIASPVCQDDVAVRRGTRPFLAKTPYVPGLQHRRGECCRRRRHCRRPWR